MHCLTERTPRGVDSAALQVWHKVYGEMGWERPKLGNGRWRILHFESRPCVRSAPSLSVKAIIGLYTLGRVVDTDSKKQGDVPTASMCSRYLSRSCRTRCTSFDVISPHFTVCRYHNSHTMYLLAYCDVNYDPAVGLRARDSRNHLGSKQVRAVVAGLTDYSATKPLNAATRRVHW